MQTRPNNTTHPTRPLSRWLSLLAALALTACANLSGKPPQEQVRQRATERWQALIAGDFSRAYSYTTPGYRALFSADTYRGRFGTAITWIGSEVVNVNCPEAAKCVARLRVDFTTLMNRKLNDKIFTHVDETWLYEGGQWWFYQDIK